ncbi:unnamed protein product [Phaeothamnion confervicola]
MPVAEEERPEGDRGIVITMQNLDISQVTMEIEGRSSRRRLLTPHRTAPVPRTVYNAPRLGELCIRMLAANSEAITDLRGLDELSVVRLLREIMAKQKLTFGLARVFLNSGHEDVKMAIESLNLLAGVPVGKAWCPKEARFNLY